MKKPEPNISEAGPPMSIDVASKNEQWLEAIDDFFKWIQHAENFSDSIGNRQYSSALEDARVSLEKLLIIKRLRTPTP